MALMYLPFSLKTCHQTKPFAQQIAANETGNVMARIHSYSSELY